MKNKQDSEVTEAAVTKGLGATWCRAQEPGLAVRVVCRCWNHEGGTGGALKAGERGYQVSPFLLPFNFLPVPSIGQI